MDIQGKLRRLTRGVWIGLFGTFAAAALVLVYAAVVPTGATLPIGSKATPFALTVFSFASLPPEVQAQEASTAPNLFDRDTTSEHVVFAESQLTTAFESPQDVRAIKIFGPAPYLLTVQADTAGSYQTLVGLENLNLTLLPTGWTTFTAATPVTTGKLLFVLTPATGGTATGLRELEIWTTAAPVSVKNGAALLDKLLGPTPPPQGRLYNAFNPTANPTVGVVTPTDSGADLADNKFSFTLDREPSQLVRAYLTYELFGQASFVSVRRDINGLNSTAGGGLILPTATWSTQVERINPAWLKLGANTVLFSVLSSSFKDAGFTVRNVRVIGELDTGANMIETITVNAPDAVGTNPIEALYDGDLATGWKPYPADQPIDALAPSVEFTFRRPTQMEAVSFYLSAPIQGQLQVSVKQAGLWIDFPAETGAVLDTGWNTIYVPAATPLAQRVLEGVRLTFQGGFVSNAEIRELLFIGSGVGGRTTPPKIVVAYPDAGQFYGRRAYVQGFIEPWNNGSGLGKITLGGINVAHFFGTIEAWIGKNDVGLLTQADNDAWSAELKVVYPNGETVSTIIPFTQQMSEAVPASGPVAGSVSGTVSNKGKKTLSHDESTLVFDTGTVATDTTVTIKPLLDTEVPALDVGMTNVTKGPRRGYRFTPHGAKFLKNVSLALPYDKALIPPGHTEDDVKTFYFDDQAGRWVELTRVSVDKTAKVINSQTNHFTDMINATITVPDHPNPTSFNPTSMKDIKAADPGAQVNLIEAPKVNNMGDTRLNYPIEVPPGRSGMQPNLSINYNSSGGNGWLGVGWELSTPSISIDTRFGVPKYNEATREETYLLNGQQLVKMPNGEYRPRIEGAFDRIVRRGDSPANYWWVVTDKNGTRQIFGGDTDAQLRSSDRIFTWHLNRTVNANGNTVDYLYEPKLQPVHNGGEPATYSYLKEIRYTGFVGANKSDDAVRNVTAASGNYYRVSFLQDPVRRLDAVVDGRPGFKTVLDERLKTIQVDLVQGAAVSNIRSYVLNYKLGDFDKTLLESIAQKGVNGQDFVGNKHGFDYFTMPKINEDYDAFASVENWAIPAIPGGLGQTVNRDLYAGLFLGFMIFTDAFHIGGGFGAGAGDSTTKLSTVDLNGDGLPDFLRTGNTYYKNQWSHATRLGVTFNGTGLPSDIDSLGFDQNKVRSRDLGIHLGDHSEGAGFSGNLTRGKSTTTITGSKILSDINGDGLVDQLSVSGGTLLVRLNNGNGFDAPINWAGGVNITPPLTAAEKQQLLDDYPLSDPVRAWQAPFAGNIKISGTVSKPTPANLAEEEDGVRLLVFKGTGATPIYEKTFVNAETLDLATVAELQNLDVTMGESLYFRLNAIEDSAKDVLNTEIVVSYASITLTDSNGAPTTFTQVNDPRFDQTTTGDPQFSSSSQTAFAIATLALKPDPLPPDPLASPSNPQPAPPLKLNTNAAFKMPYKGTIRLTNVISKDIVAEDLRFRVVRLDEASGGALTSTILLDRMVTASDTSAINDVIDALAVTTDTRLVFDVSAPKLGTVRADRIQWAPEIRYTNVCKRRRAGENIDDPATITPGEGQTRDDFLNEEICSDLTPAQQEQTDRDLPGAFDPQDGSTPTKLFIFKPTPILNVYPFARQQPMQAWVAPRDGLVRIVAKAFKNVKTSSDMHFKVQSTNQLLAQYTFAADAVQPDTQVIAVDVQVQAGQRLFFNVHSQTSIPKTVTVFSGPDDTVGQEVTVFGWTPEILYVDPQHCYIDAQTSLEKCVPVSTNYITPTLWNMHFDQLCLAQDRCVVVDCTGTRTPGVPSARTADACVTTEPDPNSPPGTTPPQTIRVPLTAAERAAFNLNREQYFVPVTNRDYLDWTPYTSTPFLGFYRDWAYLSWNGNFAWDITKLVNPPSVPASPTQEEADNVQSPYFWSAQPSAFGNNHHDGTAIWAGPGDDNFMSALQAQPSRLGGNVTPFASAGNGAGISLLRRTRNEQTKTSAGFGPVGASKNEGPATTNVDLIDLNGDRYPDQVADNSLVFNHGTPGSGFDSGATGVDFSINGESAVRKTVSKTVGLSFSTGGGSHEVVSMSSVGGGTKGVGGMNGIQGEKSLGLSIGTGYGSSKTVVDFVDINGDGLPDRVYRNGSSVLVRLNLGGDRFGAQENWTAPAWSVGNVSRLGSFGPVSPNAVRITDTINASASSFAASGSRTIVDLTDINGDGLPDLVMKEHGKNYFLVRINRGSGFDDLQEKRWIVPDWNTTIGRGATALLFGGNDVISYNESITASTGYSYPFHIDFTVWVIEFHIFIEPEVNATIGESNSSLALMDVDGDGAPDQVYRTASLVPGGAGADQVKVKRSKIGKTNLLKFVSRPLGGSFDLDYLREGNFVDRSDPNNIIEMNTSKWVMSQVMVHDGQGNSYPTQYKHFTSGFYHRGERENFGFSHCQEIRADGATTDYFYHNQDYTKKGLLFRKIYRDKFGALFNREDNNYDVFTIQLAQGTRPAVRFPAPSHKESHFYEGTSTLIGDIAVTTTPAPGVKRRAESYTYETEFGNVVALTDFGDLDSATDDVQASIGYFKDLSAYILKPNSIIASSGASLLRQREASFSPGTGNLTQVRQAIGNGQTAVTDLTYFSNGNLQTVTGPANQLTQRYTLNYEYDPALDTHVKRVSDNFLLSSQADYNLLFGKIAVSRDTNNNITTTNYDDFGRISSIIGPYEQTTGNTTLRFDYHPEGSPGCAAPGVLGCAGTVPFALTQHLDLDALGNTKAASGTIDTVLFTDGLKRVLQTKKDATVLEGSAPLDRMIVSGRTVFDEVGRTIKQFYPTVEPLGQRATFKPAFDASAPPTVMDYDAVDRNTKITLPDGTFTTISYGFGPDRSGANQFETVVTDANVNALLKGAVKRTYRDARELITAVKESNNLQTIWTSYNYDALKQITQVLDDKNNTTTITYDNLGRRLSIDNPDTGKTETQYDTAGNVTKKITATLREQLKSIDYAYDFNRLSTITYLNFPGNNVSYTYGAPGSPNNTAGRITKVISHTTATSQGNLQDTEERQYGKLGEVVYEKKTVVTFTDPLHPSMFETRFAFDTFGRLLRLTYPDGEVLTNTYDSGGNLQSTQGDKNGYHYNYLKQLSYDKFEQRILVEAGNNVKTAYTYDATTRRLNTLTSGKGNGNLFQNLNYSYDKVGNVLGLSNIVDIPPASSYGGPTTQLFSYDELYRLTHAEGTFQTSPNKTHTYGMDLAYDSIHNIVSKHQLHTIVQPSLQAITQKKTSYDFNYQYNASGLNSIRPHAPIHIGDRTYKYDLNGNQTGWTQDTNGTNRTIIWNEENRIESISDQGHTKTYKYDDEGNRVIKRGPQGETVYVNQFYTQRPGATGTKHVFAGTSRIVSKLVKQDTPGANPLGRTPFEKDLFFYHPDHLGTSNYITDTNGKLYEHLEYFPFGETWVEENSNTQRTPYLFTAKELDEETGLYYFGARYYDPRTSVWQSADPILGKYLPTGDRERDRSLPGMGGVFNSPSLSLYSYGHLNPVKYKDPDGNYVEAGFEALSLTLGVVSFKENVSQGNYLAATADALGVVADAVLTAIPGAPGVVGLGIKASREAGEAVAKTAAKNIDSVWSMSPMARGQAIEAQLAKTEYKDWFNIGQLNNGKFPLVDFQKGNTLVSLKSVDTTGTSWLGGMRKHIDALATSGATVNGAPANMVLDLRVQSGGAQAASGLIEYGRQQGVTVIVKEF